MTNPSKQYDVAVVGGGVAGIRAAAGLAVAGLSVVVLEARARIGGRALSIAPHCLSNNDNNSLSHSIIQRLDLGATWFWPQQEPTVAGLVAEFQKQGLLNSFEQHHVGRMVVATAANATPLAVPHNQLDAPGTGRLVQGMGGLVECLRKQFLEHASESEIRLSSPVTSIRCEVERDVVVVSTAAGDVVEVRDVIIAVPPQLAVEKIQFTPPLPDAIIRIARDTPVWMADTVKVVVEFAGGPFWRDAGFAGAAYDGNAATGPMREIHDMGVPASLGAVGAIFGFCSLSTADDAISEESIRRQVEVLFGNVKGYVAPTAVHINDWRREPWTVASSAHALLPLPRGHNYGHSLYHSRNPVRWLLWSSTETSTSSPGHIEGALEAADRSVKSVLERRKKKT
eukprot:PhM_4_TR13285/c0_g1_i1/m.36375/K00274/MAO, aofH; monoamine oxidase